MTEHELIDNCRKHLNSAEWFRREGKLEKSAEHMNTVLDLLIEELVGGPPKTQPAPCKPFNPEFILSEIAIAIKHRTISTTHRWSIVYYHTRLTCVPSYITVPPEIILHEFTDKMANDGFSTTYWNQLKQNVIKLYKELER